MDHLILLASLQHFFRFTAVHGHGLFAKDMFTGTGGGNGNFVMQVLWSGDVDDVNVVPLDDFPPVGFDTFPAPLLSEIRYVFFVPTACDLEYRLRFGFKK